MKNEDGITIRCPKCGSKKLEAYQSDGVLAGLIQNKCERCKTITDFLMLQDKVYIYDDKLRNNPTKIKKLLDEFKNKLPKDNKIDILRDITARLF